MRTHNEFDDWVHSAIEHIRKYGAKVNKSPGCAQSTPIFDRQAEIMFLGVSPAENGNWEGVNLDGENARYYKGNNPEGWSLNQRVPAYKRWNWIFNPKNEKNAFRKAEWSEVVEQGNYLFYNIYMFGSMNKPLARKYGIHDEELNLICDLIFKVFKPKRVICLSIKQVYETIRSRRPFENERELNVYREDGRKIGFSVMRGERDGIVFYGINSIFWTQMCKDDFDAAIKAIKDDKI